MGSIPLPALDIATAQPQADPIAQYGRLMQLKQSLANAPLQRQALEQQVQQGQQSLQGGQIQLEQQQQNQQDQQFLRAAASDPANKGKTVGDLAELGLSSGKISPQTYTQLKNADLEQRSKLASLDKEQLAVADSAHKQLQQVHDAAMDMSDEQLQQNWPQIAQAANAVHGNTNMHLDPAKALTKEQINQLSPMLAMQGTYLSERIEKHKKQQDLEKTTAETELAKANAERGGTTDTDKFVSDYLKSHSMENTPANRQAAFREYTKETKIEPAQVRSNTFLQMPQAVVDPNNSSRTIYTTRKGALGMEAPGSGEAMAARAAAGAGVKADAQSLAKLQTNFDQVSAFENTAGKNLDLYIDKLSKIPDLGGKFANVPMRMINEKMIGTANYQAMKAAQQTAASEAAKVLSSASASGVLSDSQKKEAENMLSGNLSLPAAKAVVETLKQDFANRHQSYKQQLGEIRGRLNPGQQEAAPPKPQGVPDNAVWNPQGHNGAGSWQIK